MKLVFCVTFLAFAFQGNQAVNLARFNGLLSDTFGADDKNIVEFIKTYNNSENVKKCFNDPSTNDEVVNRCKFLVKEQLKELLQQSETLLKNYVTQFCQDEAGFPRPSLYIPYHDDKETGVAFYDKTEDGYQNSGTVLTANEAFSTITNSGGSYMFTIEDNELKNGTLISSNISVYKRDPCDGKLKLSFTEDSNTDLFTIALDPNEQFILTGDYSGGNVFVGSFQGEYFIQTDAFIPLEANEDSLCPNKIVFNPVKPGIVGICYTCWDRILFAEFDSDSGSLVTSGASAVLTNGSAPTDIVFSNDGVFVYVVAVLSHKVTVFETTENLAGTMSFKNIQERATVPESEFENTKVNAAMVLHPNGNFLYVINYGSGSITAYAIDTQSGLLSEPTYLPTDGTSLYSIAISSDGNQLFVSDYYSNLFIVYNIDVNTGMLSFALFTDELIRPGSIRYSNPTI